MKKFLLVATLACVCSLSADDRKASVAKPHAKSAPKTLKYDMKYFRFGVTGIESDKMWAIAPQFGVGKRMVQNENGIDYSASIGYSVGNKVLEYALPRVSYVRYLQPLEAHSAYYTLGGSWGGIHNFETKKEFHGLLANVGVGLEFARRSRFSTLLQLDVAIPAIAAYKNGSTPSPTVTVSYGIGF